MGKDATQHRKYIVNCIMKWLLFGVIIIAAPPIFNCLYRTIVGRFVNYYEVLPDISLIVLSLCCNIIAMCFDGDKCILFIFRWALGIILGIISVGCWGLYFIIQFSKEILKKFNLDVLVNIDSINLIDNNMSKRLFDIFTIIIVLCAIIGSIIEYFTVKKK